MRFKSPSHEPEFLLAEYHPRHGSGAQTRNSHVGSSLPQAQPLPWMAEYPKRQGAVQTTILIMAFGALSVPPCMGTWTLWGLLFCDVEVLS